MHRRGTISLSLIGINDGVHPFEMQVDAREINNLGEEFQGAVTVSGVMHRSGRRVHIDATVTANAHLMCDLSLEDFVELYSPKISLEYRLDNELAASQAGADVEPDEIRGIREDLHYLDITDDVRQELMLALPMKRVAPQYRDKDIVELHPELLDEPEPPADDRWAALRNLTSSTETKKPGV